MNNQSKLLDLFGQIRIYSIIDLVLLAIVLNANAFQAAGIILLHIGYLLYLEFVHKHKYRAAFPKYLWLVLFITGTIFYNSIAVIGFLICSFFYVKKKLALFGLFSPCLRGLQYYFLASGVAGFLNPVSFLACGLVIIRNFAGDLRDISRDRKEGFKTIPVLLGLKKDVKYIHLLAMMGTTFIWWYMSGISVLWLIPIYTVQIGSYNITAR
jgi:hypothetical protein